jgi:hypothetical protein
LNVTLFSFAICLASKIKTFFIDYSGHSAMLHVFMSNCLKGVRAYCDLCANSIIFEIAWLLLQIHYESGGGGGGGFGNKVSFFRKVFFS